MFWFWFFSFTRPPSEGAVEQVKGSANITKDSIKSYKALQEYVATIVQSCSAIHEETAQQRLNIVTFLETLRDKTWIEYAREGQRSGYSKALRESRLTFKFSWRRRGGTSTEGRAVASDSDQPPCLRPDLSESITVHNGQTRPLTKFPAFAMQQLVGWLMNATTTTVALSPECDIHDV